jgi:hypothetical protein
MAVIRRIEGYSWVHCATRADELNCWQPEALAIWRAGSRKRICCLSDGLGLGVDQLQYLSGAAFHTLLFVSFKLEWLG